MADPSCSGPSPPRVYPTQPVVRGSGQIGSGRVKFSTCTSIPDSTHEFLRFREVSVYQACPHLSAQIHSLDSTSGTLWFYFSYKEFSLIRVLSTRGLLSWLYLPIVSTCPACVMHNYLSDCYSIAKTDYKITCVCLCQSVILPVCLLNTPTAAILIRF